jgi:hypothetical protein
MADWGRLFHQPVKPIVNLAPMPDPHDDDGLPLVVNPINDPVTTDTDAVHVSGELLAAGGRGSLARRSMRGASRFRSSAVTLRS